MFKEMRKIQRQLSHEETIEILNSADYGFIAINGEEYGYGVPVNHVYLNDKIYFHCAREGYKLDRISKNNKVSFTAVTKHDILADKFSTDFRSVMAFGEAEEVFGEEKIMALMALIEKFSPQYIEEGRKYIERGEKATKVYGITVNHITGKGRK
ncbi:pyridoxamine 5'-phosphate oxidase family protein [Desnuesiella massiliensis]|uniref:pyridoxamine 5'-phosphate oxidase family protein n=1 Tax=Desnuesiella massiliensis TaxID=1650662 RepID=UPI0006E209B0|nr:pyridoxamine 5'-phosphate oxidase family protein [Desnuesiella massiliensis]